MSDLISRADAVSMEDHIKELNDLAVEWKTKFAKAEKITDEIYDETMAKVAKECEECKERLRNIHPSAEAEPSLKAIKRQIEEQWYLDPPSAEAVSFEDAMEIRNTILFKEYMRGRRDAEAVQGEWIDVNGDGSLWRCNQCKNTSCCKANFCPDCGAKMRKGGDE